MPQLAPGASAAYTQSYVYEASNEAAAVEVPGRALGPQDFHCERVLNSWTDLLTSTRAGWRGSWT